jgi:predicted AlkP superfamily pyrophosphatase or phosphodiesterase
LLKRTLAAVVALLVAGGIAAFALRTRGGVPEDAPSQEQMARSLGAAIMEHLYRGHVPGRSAEIMLVPKPNNFLIGEWDLTTLDTSSLFLDSSHPNPWNYLARVPIVLFGDDRVPAGVTNYDEVDISQLAPTYAQLLGADEFHSESPPLPRALEGNATAPKVIFTVVIDGGGWDVLQQHPDAWPFIAKLREHGTTYLNATIGSAPSITGALHATFGTGAYPLQHGIPGNQMRAPDGSNTDTWRQEADPRYLKVPTVSEIWDETNGNRPIVATVSFEGWHLGMIGHGAQRDGGDRDIAVLWEVEDNSWWINEDYYTLPEYLQTTNLARLEAYERALDGRDGVRDGLWFTHPLDEIQNEKVRPSTPAFVKFTGDAVVNVLRRENIGQDSLTDMMWVEMKMPDYAGHQYNMTSREEADVLRETDAQIARYVRELNRTVGRGNYVFAVSADHGQQPLPELVGGWRINNVELERDIEDEFGPIVEKITPVDIYLDRNRVEDDDVDPNDVVRWLSVYTLGDNIPEQAAGSDRVPDARRDDELFAAAFTTQFLSSLSPARINSFGQGDYPEGDFTVGPDE